MLTLSVNVYCAEICPLLLDVFSSTSFQTDIPLLLRISQANSRPVKGVFGTKVEVI